MSGIKQQFAYIISQHLGKPVTIKKAQGVGGGCINQGFYVQSEHNDEWFIKTNQPGFTTMFAAEYAGLEAIYFSQTLRCPRPLTYGETRDFSYLIMEYLPLGGHPHEKLAGQQLARMHQHTQSRFGWHRNNTIGSTPQSNQPHCDWVDFWREERLLPQLTLALKQGYHAQAYERGLLLCEQLEQFFTGYQPQASLLHGDLWRGNLAYTLQGEPVIFDPAVYYGDRETDLAMTELFGGLEADFYAAYNAAWPLDNGYTVRKTLYNLYHILNHFNLFGGGYGREAASMTEKLLSRI